MSSTNAYRGVAPPLRRYLDSAHRTQTVIRVRYLANQEDKRERLGEASKDTVRNRRFLNLTRADAWESVLRTNQALFESLQRQAASSRNGETPCTICDGFSYLRYCVICNRNDGLCPSCGGTGEASGSGNALCPTCEGTGKCYGCNGAGKMLCPFCDDGMVLAEPYNSKYRRLPE
jgi:hypothetical protein